MNFIDYIFGDYIETNDTVWVKRKDGTEAVESASSLTDSKEIAVIEMILQNESSERSFGKVVGESDPHTFKMVKGKESVYVQLFENPQIVDVDINYTIPLEENGWKYHETSGELYEFGENNATKINDAVLIGDISDSLNAFLATPVPMLIGSMWGQGDSRNTKDKDWKTVTMPWSAWIAGGAATKATPAWGFSRHVESKHKEGACFVLGTSLEGARKAKAMDTMYAIGLDFDSGSELQSVLDTLKEKNIFSIVYTSYNHRKRGVELKHDDVVKKLGLRNSPDIGDVKLYMQEHSPEKYSDNIVNSVKIIEQKKQTAKGLMVIADTMPFDKYRVIIPLKNPVKLIDLAGTHEEALAVWEDKITGTAVELLDAHFDTSCTDPSRLFFSARHMKDTEFGVYIIAGEPVDFEDLPTYKKSVYTKTRGKLSPFELAGMDSGIDKPQNYYTPSGRLLNDWHSKGGKTRLMLADLLDGECPDKIRTAGGEREGHVHVECPFEHYHSSDGGTATMAINSLDSENGYWTWFCHHDSCQGRHKLEYLEKALEDGWFDESLLFQDDGIYMLPLEDSDEKESNEEIGEGAVVVSHKDTAKEFNSNSTEDEIRQFFLKLMEENTDTIQTKLAIAVLSKATGVGIRDLNSIYKSTKKNVDKEKAKPSEDSGFMEVNTEDFKTIVNYADTRIRHFNNKTPSIFYYMEQLCQVRETSEGNAVLRFMSREEFAHHLNNVANFVKVSGVGEDLRKLGVSAPPDVVSHLYAGDHSTYPEIRGVVTTPIFTSKGTIITNRGYDATSKLYYKPDMAMETPKISPKPTEAEIFEAKRVLIEDIMADFPLGGLTRTEMIQKALYGDGVAAVANMFALILLPFARELIDGPTPGHLLVKPAPGTGASLLTDAFSIIATGHPTPALSMPPNKDELAKTLTSVLANGQNIVFFDNINHSVDSGELASAMTTKKYQARLLGKSQTIETAVRCAWVFTGNNVTLSSELVRRLIMIDLDARVANPELRGDFKHEDIRGWATDNRGKLVWACLTLIQNWVAKGMPLQNDAVLASFENWSRVIGGILKEAGIKQFMANRSKLVEKATDSSQDELEEMLDMWWELFENKLLPVKGVKGKPSLQVLAEEIMELTLNLKKRKNSDGDLVYSPKDLSNYLSAYKDRVFVLSSGKEIQLLGHSDPIRKGHITWQLAALER